MNDPILKKYKRHGKAYYEGITPLADKLEDEAFGRLDITRPTSPVDTKTNNLVPQVSDKLIGKAAKMKSRGTLGRGD